MNVPIPVKARACNGKTFRWRFVFSAITSGGAVLAIASAYGWQTPAHEWSDLKAADSTLRRDMMTANALQDRRGDRSDSTHARELDMIEGMATDLCLHRTPVERVRLRLPCRDLLREALLEFPPVKER